MDKEYCRICGKEIECGVEPLPLEWCTANRMFHYCGEHADIGEEIYHRFCSERKRIEIYDVDKFVYKLESSFKQNCGDWDIKFANSYHRGSELINTPIVRDGQPIGFITEVDDEYIKGRIWSRYIPIVEEAATGDQNVKSFELVC